MSASDYGHGYSHLGHATGPPVMPVLIVGGTLAHCIRAGGCRHVLGDGRRTIVTSPSMVSSNMPSLDVLSRDSLVIPSFQKVEHKVMDLLDMYGR